MFRRLTINRAVGKFGTMVNSHAGNGIVTEILARVMDKNTGEINWVEFTRKTGNPDIDNATDSLREDYVEKSLSIGRSWLEKFEREGYTLTGDTAPGDTRKPKGRGQGY